MSEALIIFVRNPELGKVKTRLGSTLGQEKALEIYKLLLKHTLYITKNLPVDKFVFYDGDISAEDMWATNGYHQLLQIRADLGKKMYDAFQTIFEKGFEKVVIIGSDCIELTKKIINEAFDILTTHDAVIGPANDGGYYLLGTKKLYPPLFENKEWSTDVVYAATLKDLKAGGLSYVELPVLIDIDTEEDWKKAKQKNNQTS